MLLCGEKGRDEVVCYLMDFKMQLLSPKVIVDEKTMFLLDLGDFEN